MEIVTSQSAAHFGVTVCSVVTYQVELVEKRECCGENKRAVSLSRKVWVGFNFRFCYQVLGTTALLKSFSSCLCERVIFIALLKINSILVLCSAPRNQACWERESK